MARRLLGVTMSAIWTRRFQPDTGSSGAKARNALFALGITDNPEDFKAFECRLADIPSVGVQRRGKDPSIEKRAHTNARS